MAKRGRKSAWETKIEPHLDQIMGWARNGHLDKQICEALGISHQAFCKYKKLKDELREALKVNKEIADLRVEDSLYKRALGYQYEEIHTTVRAAKGNQPETVEIKKIKKTVLPDTTAQIFWLKNRKRLEWRDVWRKDEDADDSTDAKPVTLAYDPTKRLTAEPEAPDERTDH